MTKAKRESVVQKPEPGTLVLQELKSLKPMHKALGGSNSDDFNHILLNSVANTLRLRADDEPEERTKMLRAAAATLMSVKPENEIEGMLIGQMIACNAAAMECFRRAMLPDHALANRQTNLSFATKLARTYALHLEALDKHRGKGQQKVTVEHVHVHQGGQAIVGNVASGGGSAAISEELPHAHSSKPTRHSLEPTLQGTFTTDWRAVPVSSYA